MRLCFHRGITSLDPRAFPLPPLIMLCLGLGTAWQCGRTECAPPRKPPSAPSPGLPPQGRSSLHSPPPRRGGLRTPAKEASRQAQHCPPFGQGPSLNAPVGDAMPCHLHGRTMRTRGARPSEKIGFRVISGLPCKATSPRPRPPRRGGLRTPGGRHRLDRGMPSLGHGHPPRVMKCLGMSKALQRGRGDRAPPRKPPFTSSPGFPRRAILACIAQPAEGSNRTTRSSSRSRSPRPTSSSLARPS